ncbi:inorganic phosphate transporter [Methanospirillum hungatei]|jgi:PiT family inorganic phosphate transporter|uniref:inorganic phosphate transporter n=1 Tax=Methanospirillum hungatei TaxID=2203 RepID=UPI0009CE49EC|nr:inorganic phosphate transporter [Methanospirillum hungatei]MBP9009399.1 inorganic phosphate transporter [Methanospirillum sp.]OQA55562.1 MAG: Phosphate transporter family protein [Euryarchaeota archaeon ADurb.Bin294]HOW05401.1 inorganic phosphate transporter [Methanospirillum hungatei]
MEFIIIFGISLALLFNFVNGLNDAGNSIATIVATRALRPLYALILAAVCNIAGPFLLTTAIAKTIGTGVVQAGALTPVTLVIALFCGVLLLSILTAKGFPISASHALIGCMVGSSIAAFGLSTVIWPSLLMLQSVAMSGFVGALCGGVCLSIIFWILKGPVKLGAVAGAVGGFSLMIVSLMGVGALEVSGLLAIFIFIVISPTIGFLGGFFLDILVSYIFRFSRQSTRNKIFFPLQVVAGGIQAIGHGANDGLHAVGIIAALFIAGGLAEDFSAPFWVMAASALSIGAGTVFGGWNVITRMAKGITRIRPYQGFCASTAGGLVISALTISGIPTSSTHIISGSIVGVGATRGKNAVDWNVVRDIVTTWIVTFPLAVTTSAACYIGYSFFLQAGLIILDMVW